MKTVISCFDKTTNFVRPWAEAGYECYCIDIQHEQGEHKEGNIFKVGEDILKWNYIRLSYLKDIAFIAFFPPCTDTAVSGARWLKNKGIGALIEALRLFERSIEIAEYLEAPYFIENPVSTISTYWRKPDYMFDPCDYGDPYTKKTCLWTGNGFKMPFINRVEPTEGSKMHLVSPSPERANIRAATSTGFAKAVFEANK